MSGQNPPNNHPPAARWQNFHKETPEDKHRRYALIFSKLDRNKDGTVCVSDLQEVLKSMGSKNPSQAAEVRHLVNSK